MNSEVRVKTRKIIEELSRIAKANHGLLKPEHVVESARDKYSPLHSQFCWDNTKAAHEYRLWQARELIVSVRIKYPELNKKTQIWVSLQSDRKKGDGYREMIVVLSNKTKRQQLLQDALKELETFQEKYQSLTELSKIFAEIDKIKKKL